MNRLKELRLEKKMSQSKLAETFNISQQSISHYEKGIRDMDNDLIKSMSSFFNVSADYLLGISNNRNYNSSEETIALHSDYDYKDLPDEARKEIKNYIEYIKQKYKK
ncbi:helix-turn-helix domain-containing protein [Clostridium paraputrificum]|uniref:helix-turn-helix domain-containing protein n=1 Tax=Clostridium paraputrificum TaxID=29363 RepID=UPI00374F2CD1